MPDQDAVHYDSHAVEIANAGNEQGSPVIHGPQIEERELPKSVDVDAGGVDDGVGFTEITA